MDVLQIAKNTQEQGVAAWVDYLNQLRLNELLEKLAAQDINLEQALAELQKFKDFIGDPARILGSTSTKHGEIAENAQVYISNARRLIEGLAKEYSFEGVARTAPEDYLKNGQQIQSKFLNGIKATLNGSGNANGIRQHIEKYPWFVKNGGSYEIPKDQYDEIMRVLQLRQNSPTLLTRADRRLLDVIDSFEKATGLCISKDVRPAVVNYGDVQQGTVSKTISKEEDSIRETDQRRRKEAYEASKPTLREGVKTAGVSAAMEGGMAFCLGVWKKRKQGKHLAEFTAEDWNEIGIDTTKGTLQGGIRGGVIYTMTNFTATPAAVANALVTASFGVAAQAYQLQQGNITADDFIVNSEVLCLDVSVSAVASIFGQTLIPVPVLGAIIGNMAGMFLYQIAKDYLSEKEQVLISNYQQTFICLNKMLEERYQELISRLKKELAKYASVLELAFDKDVNIAFGGSIALADYVGVTTERVLRNKHDIDQYFLN